MHVKDRSTAQAMRRASMGPHAMMQRQTLQPFVPGRGSAARRSFRGYSGLGASNLMSSASGGYVGASVGAAASGFILGGATTVAGSIAGAAAAGSFVPIIGTAIGAVIGLVMSGVFNHRVDPEVANFNAAVQLYNMQGPAGILNIADKYLVLAGLFDLEPGQIKGNIPIYKRYGRMGEQAFTQDMCNLVFNAAQSGQITDNDTVQSVFSNIVMPWIDKFGYGPMQDSNAGMISAILLGLVAEYITGLWKKRWFARAGDFPNWNIQTFSLPAVMAPAPAPIQPTASATPSPVAVPYSTPALPAEMASYQAGQIPAVGSTIHYAWNLANGQTIGLPNAGTFMGRTVQGAWIVQLPSGTYVLNGTWLPYQPATSVTSVNAAGGTTSPVATVATANTSTSPTVGNPQSLFPTIRAPVVMSSSGQQSISTVPGGLSMGSINPAWIIGGGLGLVLLVLMLKKKGAKP